MTNSPASGSPEHPSHERHAVKLSLLWFGLLAAPLAWMVEALLSYLVFSRLCNPELIGAVPTPTASASFWFWAVLVTTLAIALSGGAVALHNWRLTRGEKGGSDQHLMQIGEGRSRFLAMGGMLTSGGSLIGYLFMLSNLLLVPLCVA